MVIAAGEMGAVCGHAGRAAAKASIAGLVVAPLDRRRADRRKESDDHV
jgi:hypothetical protein